MLLKISVVIAAAALSFQAAAQEGRAPLVDGLIQQINRELTSTRDDSASRVAIVSGLDTARTTRLRIDFVPATATVPSGLTVIVKDAGGNEVIRYPAEEIARERRVWTPLVKGASARVEMSGSATTGAEFRIIISAVASHVPPAKPTLNIIREFDLEDIEYIRVNQPVIYTASRPVAKLSFVFKDQPAVCTGFMINETQMLTNHHCINTSEDICKSTIVMFGFHKSEEPMGEESQKCVRVIAEDKDLDATLIEVAGSPGTRWGFLALSDGDPTALEPSVVVQHPAGFAKFVVRKDCVVSTFPADGVIPNVDFGHSCDTMEGSSGSPVLRRADLKVVGLHHWGFDRDSERWKAENRAVQIKFIKQKFGL